jgi:uncharacterized protein YcbK (DUF882 family)
MPFGAPEDDNDNGLLRPENRGLDLTRRGFLGLAIGAAVTLASGTDAMAATLSKMSERRVRLRNVHTGETFDGVYWSQGKYLKPQMQKLSWVLRDHRANKSKSFDPKLFDQLCALADRLDADQPFQVISGYRTQQTNNAKRRRGESGVARNSFHIKAKAIDIYLPDRSLAGVKKVALRMRAGGVGYYGDSGFVHLDTGPVRTW